ncbi:adenylate/guanylate cyclase domain-containing protein [Spirochaeta thermophila]|uniref:Adenylate/guanylate cyclase n=1 Tax=Winmispira thermophila (strain ATCC 49972 / DSM 6192 / RI 19.B1) TaxID=665571 RepID=E0RT14_WINT6|nr:adenylate/guanylate cyclase domain-containing protein [Spirochaeta thermophila]ADN02151.1 adenylate/guanylate cyclase [Spirochaeta thermophila DSM 6192]
MKGIVPITRKVTLLISGSLIVGIGLIVGIFTTNIVNLIRETTAESLVTQSELLYNAIENFMMPGEAPLAVNYFMDISEDQPGTRIRLFRADGTPAFSDTTTILQVNTRLGGQRFSPSSPRAFVGVPPLSDDLLARIGSPYPHPVQVQDEAEGRTYLTVYSPLINLPKCTVCHGEDHTVRGIVEIQDDITSSVQTQQANVIFAGSAFLTIVIILGWVLTFFLRRSVLEPVRKIGEVCAAVTNGNFHVRVDLRPRDEIGLLGETVNTMVQGLYERFELSKFVSRTTIRAVQDASEEGVRTTMVLLFSDVRGFTSFADREDPARVVHALNELLSLQTSIVHAHEGDIDKYVGDEVFAFFQGIDAPLRAARAALDIQRVLEERKDQVAGLSVGIGIHAGEVILGKIGSAERADFTVIGDSVNLASRLCDVAPPGKVVISDAFHRLLGEAAVVEGPYRLSVKGKKEDQKVYMLVGLKGEDDAEA